MSSSRAGSVTAGRGESRRHGFVASCLALFCLTLSSCRTCSGPISESPRLSPLSAEEQAGTFTLPEGFDIELVAADPDMGKIVDIAFDDAGRLWAVTAMEYPMDQNDGIADAAERYRRGGRDQVLVFDTPYAQGRQRPRVFADGLFIPLTVLPLSGGVLVGQGPDILQLSDSDGDGRADQRRVVLTGFGVQDSHNNPHRFLRGPGGWIYFAQGGFAQSAVQQPGQEPVPFDTCKVGRFRPDGSGFEVFVHGLLNIWGMIFDDQGEFWIQEANDIGYPVVPAFKDFSYPGIGRHRTRPYTPWHPPPADFRVGGTGLSGLAMSEDEGGFPEPFRGSLLLANPITRTVNSVRVDREGGLLRLEQGPDLVRSTDTWFRPIAHYFGPDGALYVVDWYNPIIRHNEVARTHPDRDKTRSRIWRVRHRSMSRPNVPDLTRVQESSLLAHLKADISWQARAAWHQIVDRRALALVPELETLAADQAQSVRNRLLALWSLEGLGALGVELAGPLLKDPQPAIRRETVRGLWEGPQASPVAPALLEPLIGDPDPLVRWQTIQALGRAPHSDLEAAELLLRMARAPREEYRPERTMREVMLTQASYLHSFERGLLRAALEARREAVRAILQNPPPGGWELEQSMLAWLSLGGRQDAAQLVSGLQRLKRPVALDELLLILDQAAHAPVRAGLEGLFAEPSSAARVVQLLALFPDRVSERIQADARIQSLLSRSALRSRGAEPGDASDGQLLDLASAYQLRDLEPAVLDILGAAGRKEELRLKALRALLALGSIHPDLFQQLAGDRRTPAELRRTALLALAESKNASHLSRVFELWEALPEAEQRIALTGLSSTPAGAAALLEATATGRIPPTLVDTLLLDRLSLAAGPDHPQLRELRRLLAEDSRQVLHLPGGRPVSFADTDLRLEGAFTVECWVRLEEGIGAGDGILGDHVSATFNFAGERLRITLGSAEQDLIVSSTPVRADEWFHVAVTRDEGGTLRIYLNGELDAEALQAWKEPFKDLDVGRTQPLIYPPHPGTQGQLAEFRVWDRARSEREIWSTYRQSFQGESPPAGLRHYYSGDQWGELAEKAGVVSTPDYPRLLSAVQARALEAKFEELRRLGSKGGEPVLGAALFEERCGVCHRAQGRGTDLGPVLDGAGAGGLEPLLRAILTPNAGVESGYRTMRVQTRDNELLEGMLVSETEGTLVLRMRGREDLHIPQEKIQRAAFLETSIMPEGLLDDLRSEEIADLLAYLMTLK